VLFAFRSFVLVTYILGQSGEPMLGERGRKTYHFRPTKKEGTRMMRWYNRSGQKTTEVITEITRKRKSEPNGGGNNSSDFSKGTLTKRLYSIEYL